MNLHIAKRYLFLGALVVGLVAAVGLRAVAQESSPEDGGGFVDIGGNIHAEDIRYIVERGLTVGCDLEGPRYCPGDPVSRAEMATFLARALRLDTTVPHLGVYTDVAEGAWYTPYVEALGAYGLTDTRISGAYRPDEPMLRSEMAIFLQKAFRLTSSLDASSSSFQDISADADYAGAAEAILEAEITRGCGEDPLRYCPDDTVKRDTMAAFLARTLRGADLRRALELAPDREILAGISIGRQAWDVWVCETAPVQEDLVVYLNREIGPYYHWLSGGEYQPRFRYGADPPPEITAILESCEGAESPLRGGISGRNVFVGGDLWEEDFRPGGVGGLFFDHQSQRFSQSVWIDKRGMYETTVYAHEIGHTLGWPHNLKEPGAPVSDPVITGMDIMATYGTMVGTNAHNLFQLGWIDPEKVAVHTEGTATYTVVPPHSTQGAELLMLPLGANRLISVGVRAQRSYDRDIPIEGVELYEIWLCGWRPGCKEVFLPPGVTSIAPVVLADGDSWTARVLLVSDGRHFQADMRVSVTERGDGSYAVKVDQTIVAEDGFSHIDLGIPGACGVRFSGRVDCWGWGGAENVPRGPFATVGLGFLACGIRTTDAGMDCWGPNYDGTPPPEGEFVSVSVLGDLACGLRKDGTLACLGMHQDPEPATQPPEGAFQAVSAGYIHGCGIRADHTVECWGRTPEGANLATPPTGEFISVSSGGAHSCGLRTEGSVTCWNTRSGQATWQPPPGRYTFVASGWNNSCAIGANGGVVCWGPVELTPPDGVFTTPQHRPRACLRPEAQQHPRMLGRPTIRVDPQALDHSI